MRFLRIFLRLLKAVPLFFRYCGEFGARAAWLMCWAYVLPSQKGSRYMDGLLRFFQRDLAPLLEQYHNGPEIPMTAPCRTLWCCWLGGEDTMPDIVKVCYDSMCRNAPEGVRLELITQENYRQHVTIPEYVEEKYRKGIISPAHFSDVLRFSLLSRYGGMWLDATVFVSGSIPESCFRQSYYTQKVSDPERFPMEPSRAQWCGFIWAGAPNNPLFCFVRDGLYHYWRNYNTVIDYIFFDYIILTAYHGLPQIRQMMDRQCPNNEDVWGLWNRINAAYNPESCRKVFQKNIFHKLSYKGQLITRTPHGQLTVYGWLLGEKDEDQCGNASI